MVTGQQEVPPVQLGLYAGPAAKNIAGAGTFESWSGAPVRRLVEFLPSTSWLEMTRIDWALKPYSGSGYQLELSVPMLPDEGDVSLAACSAGDYDAYWASIGASLIRNNLPTAAIRPGWEMNGTWYRWSAAGQPEAYAGCFRRLVTAMRSVPGAQFSFVFCSNIGVMSVPADQAYPGDDYVDVVDVDVYDHSWAWYPAPSGVSLADARSRTWSSIRSGDRGLEWWAQFGRAHGKPLGISEWGATWRADGHGGGDDAAFVDRMFDWFTDPANRVAYAVYFNSPDKADLKHNLTVPDTLFPEAGARFQQRSVAAVGGGAVTTPDTEPTTEPTTAPATEPIPSPATTPAPGSETGSDTGSGAETGPAPAEALPGTLTMRARPALDGGRRLGDRLVAYRGQWGPKVTTVGWQWFRDGQPLSGAHGRSHRLVRADLGHRLRARVTVRRPGFEDAAASTRPTGPVRR